MECGYIEGILACCWRPPWHVASARFTALLLGRLWGALNVCILRCAGANPQLIPKEPIGLGKRRVEVCVGDFDEKFPSKNRHNCLHILSTHKESLYGLVVLGRDGR